MSNQDAQPQVAPTGAGDDRKTESKTGVQNTNAERPAPQPVPDKCNLWDSQPMITIKSGNREWSVHKNVLTHESEYFRKALDGPFLEGDSSVVNLDEIDPFNLGNFISTMYASAMTASHSPFQIYNHNLPRRNWLSLRIELWKLADYFQHDRIREAARRNILKILGSMESLTSAASDSEKGLVVKNYVDAWNACAAGENCPPQLRLIMERNLADNMCPEAINILFDTAPAQMTEAVVLQMAKARDESNQTLRMLQHKAASLATAVANFGTGGQRGRGRGRGG